MANLSPISPLSPTSPTAPVFRSRSNSIVSTCADGTIITMNVFVDAANAAAYNALCKPIAKRLLTMSECLFCEMSQNPVDPEHLRIVQGWTRNSAWWYEVIATQDFFIDFIKTAKEMWIRPRIIEHFDRLPSGPATMRAHGYVNEVPGGFRKTSLVPHDAAKEEVLVKVIDKLTIECP